MNGLWLLVPFMLIRFGLLAILSREAVGRAAHFAPTAGGEQAAYWVYQLSNAALFLYLPFLRVQTEQALPLFMGLICYFGGLICCAASMAGFAAPSGGGLRTGGVYRFSPTPCTCPTSSASQGWPFGCGRRLWPALSWFFSSPPTGSFCPRSGGAWRPSGPITGGTRSRSGAIFKENSLRNWENQESRSQEAAEMEGICHVIRKARRPGH